LSNDFPHRRDQTDEIAKATFRNILRRACIGFCAIDVPVQLARLAALVLDLHAFEALDLPQSADPALEM